MKSILIVDDQALLADAYSLELTKAGSKVYIANSGNEGLKLLVQYKPDIVLLEVLMPIMNGIEFLEEVRKIKPKITSKIIVLSNIDNDDLKRACAKLGVIDFLHKFEYSPIKIGQYLSNI